MEIEHIIHQVWLGPKQAPEKWMSTWKEKHPSWKYMRWDNDTIKDYQFINRDKIDECIKRNLYHGAADLIRYEVLKDFGGFAAEADSICLNPIDELMNIDEECFTCWEKEKRGQSIMTNLLTMWLGVKKGCRLMEILIEELKQRTKRIDVPWISTGNLFFTKTVNRLNYQIKVYPSYFFLPEHYDGRKYNGTGKIYAEHYWGTTKNLYE